MKKYILNLFIVFGLMTIFCAYTVRAHSSELSYVKINGEYVAENPILEYATPFAFTMGSDISTSSGYVIHSPVVFEVDRENFPNPYKGVNDNTVLPKFRWSFGDSTEKVEGSKVTHTYIKPGTYVVNIEVAYEGKLNGYSGLNTVQINVLPFAEYKLPKAKISINSRLITDPVKEIYQVAGDRTVVLDGSASEGDIVSYSWDFSDETKGTGERVTHAYSHSEYFPMFPILRVTDRFNISHDTFIFLDAPLSTNVMSDFLGWLQDLVFSIRGHLLK